MSGPSALMLALNEEALSRARLMMTRKFSESVALDDISSLRTELQAKLSSADAKLKGAVEGKLDSLKRAVDLMEESSVKLNDLTEKIDSTEERIALTNTSISNYANVKRVHFARENIQKVISEVEKFTRIPDDVAHLRATLDEEPHRVREVYLQGMELQTWRSALLHELMVSNSSEGKGIASGHQKRVSLTKAKSARTRASSQWEDYSTDMRSRILQSVGSHLEIVLDLSKQIKKCLLSNIERLSDMAAVSPAELVTTFEVIEMHQQYVDRRTERARQRRLLADEKRRATDGDNFCPWDESADPILPSELGGGLENCSIDLMGVNMKEETCEALVRNLHDKVEASFVGITAELHAAQEDDEEENADSGGDSEANKKKRMGKKVTLTLNTATRMLGTMLEFKNVVCVCIPPSYEAMSLYMDAFEHQIQPQIEELVEDFALLEVSDIMQLIDWLEYYVDQADVFEGRQPGQTEQHRFDNKRECCKKFSMIAEELMHEYLHRIKKQVMGWFDNIKKQPLEVGKSSDGTLITSMPEDMFNVIHMQMSVAQEKLAKEHLKDVVNACMQVLREVQRQSYDSLAEKWTDMDPESLCASVNDMQRMQEKCDEFAHEVMKLVREGDDQDFLIQLLDDVSTEYVNLALKAVTFLSRLILRDLEEDVFNNLFTVEWEATRESRDSVCGILTATFKDYFIDIAEWLPAFFFQKFVRDVLTSTIMHYAMALRKKSSGSFQFNSELAVARNLITDMELLHDFFNGYLECLAKAGLGTTDTKKSLVGKEDEEENDLAAKALVDELLPLTNLARLVSATHITGAMDDAKDIYIRWGKEGLRLVFCAINANPSMDKAEKQENIDIAQKNFDKIREAGLISRNSLSVKAATEFWSSSNGNKGDIMGTVVDGLKDGFKRTGTTLRKTNWGKVRGLVASASTRDIMGNISGK